MKKSNILLAVSALFCTLFLLFIFKTADGIIQGQSELVKRADVLDVTQIIRTTALISESEIEDESWIKQDFDDSSWPKVSIPEYVPYYDKKFSPGNFIYYRIRIPKNILDKLSDLKNETFLSLQYVTFKRYEAFINGQLYMANSSDSAMGSLMNLPLKDGQENIIGIKARISDGDEGITHRKAILLGRGSVLSEIYRSSYKGASVFQYIFIFTMGSVIFVLSLIYFVLRVPPSFEKFLIFALCALLEKVCASDELYAYMGLTQVAFLFSLSNIGASLSLSLFFLDVIEKRISVYKVRALIGLGLVLAVLITLDTVYTNYYFNFTRFLGAWNALTAIVLIFFMPLVFKRDKLLSAGIVLSFVLIVWTSFFSSNIGFNYKSFGSLILFFVVAFETFRLLRNDQVLLRVKENELMAQEKDVAIGKTAAILAHDVRRPFEQIKMVLETLTNGEISKDFLQTAKRDIDYSLSAVNNQVNDIMNFSRSIQIQPIEMSFYRSLEGALKQVLSINTNVQISLVYNFFADKTIVADESRLASVLTNILTNAVEAIRDIGKKDFGEIRIDTNVNKENFQFSIANDGPCIPREILDKVFAPLFSYGKEQGTGIGLASVFKTIQDHKGRVTVENLEKGVVFKISLPLGKTDDKPSSYHFFKRSSDYGYSLKNTAVTNEVLRIFVLDDDSQVYDYFKYLISQLGLSVQLSFALTFEEGIKMIRSRRFDLYIIDYDLAGDKTGLDFYRNHLRFLSNEVVIHTNRDASIINGESCRHHLKPIDVDSFAKIINSISSDRKRVFVIDDSDLILAGWEMFHGKHNIITSSSPEDALQRLSLRPHVDYFVVDYYFDNSQMKGDELIRRISTMYPYAEILLSSNPNVDVGNIKMIRKTDFEVRNTDRG